jgi:hypothetical protein
MNEMPKRLMIGGLPHTVHVVDSGMFEDEDTLGECCFVEQRIKVLDVLTPGKTRNVLMHEIIEAITATHILDLQHETLSVLATEILRVLDDNPKLRGYLWPKK